MNPTPNANTLSELEATKPCPDCGKPTHLETYLCMCNSTDTIEFEAALDWAFGQIISPDNMAPTLAEQKTWILKQHNEAILAHDEQVKAKLLEAVGEDDTPDEDLSTEAKLLKMGRNLTVVELRAAIEKVYGGKS